MTVNSAVFDIAIGQETLLLNEDNGHLVLLDGVATAVWYGLSADMAAGEIAAFVARESGMHESTIKHDVDLLLDRWDSLGFVRRDRGSADYVTQVSADEAPNRAAIDADQRRVPARTIDDLPRLGTFGIGNVIFDLRSSELSVRHAANPLFDHLRIGDDNRIQFTLTVERQDDGWTLFCNGKYQAHCGSDRGIAPMLHANALLLVYRYSNVEIALHAAAIAVDGHCMVFPAKSGSGKSTLSAALVSRGFGFCSDDLVLLSGPDLTVVPASFCIGLKEGAWEIITPRIPSVADLAIHVREDGKAIRYLPPLPGSQMVGRHERLPTRLLVFPTYDPDCVNEHRELSPGRALVRLTEAGYDIAPSLNRKVLQRLVTWIESIRCVELRYNSLDYAIDTVASLSRGE